MKNLFIPIIQLSDVGIDPEAEEEMETIEAFGRQAIEEELEMNDQENGGADGEEEPALQVPPRVRPCVDFSNETNLVRLQTSLGQIGESGQSRFVQAEEP